MLEQVALQSNITALSESINAVWVLTVTFLIFFMQPGFALLEAGQVRAKNAGNVVMKNMMDWGMGVLVFFLVGAGVSAVAAQLTASETALSISGAFAYINDPSAWIGWLFGAVFAMTAATIVSGAVAERMKFSAYVIYAFAMVAFIYPVVAGWAWGGGLLGSGGFIGQALGGVGYKDFAGATVVHALGGIAGLTAAYMVGPRKGRFDAEGNTRPIPGHSVLFAVIGTLILAFGWYGFNVGTQATVLTADGGFNGDLLGRVALNTTLAMGAGMVASTLVTTFWEGKPDPLFGANGLLAGLVAITGACVHVSWTGALVIGIIGGIQTPIVYRWVVDSLGIDDVCGVFAVHGSAGFIGTMLIPFFDVAGFSLNQFIMQITGTLVIGTWTVLVTMAVLSGVGATIGLRVSEEEEEVGLDRGEHGMDTYPEFTAGDKPGALADGGARVETDGGATAANSDSMPENHPDDGRMHTPFSHLGGSTEDEEVDE
jgi:Amt family ammonium transporter